VKNTTSTSDWLAFIRLKLGFDPAAATRNAIKRGWVQPPAPEPPTPNGNACPAVDAAQVCGYAAAGVILGVSPSWVCTLTKGGHLPVTWERGHPVFERRHLEAYNRLVAQ
jgi:hypothetical protein